MDFWRQMDIFNPDKFDKYITLIGCGGIGSTTGICLAKMGVSKVRLYDMDHVSEHNVPNSMFRRNQVDQSKVFGLKIQMEEYGEMEDIVTNSCPFDDWFTPIMISGVDSMASRVDIWSKIKFNTRVHLYIDGRMGGQTGMVYALNPCDPEQVKKYEATLNFTDEEAVQEACTNRAIIYNTFMIAALIAHNVRLYAVGEQVPFERLFDFPTNIYWVKP